MTTFSPVHEEARIGALRSLRIIDTPAEPAFDRITRIAQNVFEVPMAAISLLDGNRQWFKSRIGVPFSETPREWSFCSRTILRHDVLVVTDASSDPEFRDSPLVCGATGIRFYAGAPLRTRDGLALGAICVMDTETRPDLDQRHRDILTDLAQIVVEEFDERRKEQELSAAKEEAERANHAKGEFLSRVSHELRTPMNAILGFTQLLALDDLQDVQRSNVDRILRSGKHLLTLLNEVLEISRIEAGRLAIELEPVSVGEAIREAAELVEPLLAERSVRLRSELLSPTEGRILADHQKLIQVVLNLLSNAAKYNRENGGILVQQEIAGDRVRVKVTDTGNGISPELQTKLFQPFERLGADRTKTAGTGLGLALSKRMVELMGGTIGVESTPGVGSTFWVEFARFDPETGHEKEIAPEPKILTGPSVLYIEDALLSFHLIRGILKRVVLNGQTGIRVISAIQGNVGLEMARMHAPDLILLDLHLPDLSGIQVLNLLKADPRTLSIPVVVLTADALPGTPKQVLDAGALACLAKPVDVAQFLNTVRPILEKST